MTLASNLEPDLEVRRLYEALFCSVIVLNLGYVVFQAEPEKAVTRQSKRLLSGTPYAHADEVNGCNAPPP